MVRGLQVRDVTVELLRPGPAHNQLLSPITQYLGVCGDAEAGVITQPFEQAQFLRRAARLAYPHGQLPDDRLAELQELGATLAQVLGAVPQLPGKLTPEAADHDVLVHLRLVLSASELAALPFELSKMPAGPGRHDDAWLSLQARAPVVITRRTRNVSSEGIAWPSTPKVLFVSDTPTDVPFDDHLRLLQHAVQPFCPVGDDGAPLFDAALTALPGARFDEVIDACARGRFTHVHMLAHGTRDPAAGDHLAHGLALGGEIVSAERLTQALTGVSERTGQRPAVVTLATCDSGNVGSVLVPVASIAHHLHRAGIPLVLASQFPLSVEGSVLLFDTFYRQLLWADEPWPLLHRIRCLLASRLGTRNHDWASLVVYEALPADFAVQLQTCAYRQARLAVRRGLEAVDRASGDERLEAGLRAVQEGLQRLPPSGPYALEGLGLRASAHKRLAQAGFRRSKARGEPDAQGPVHAARSVEHLQSALRDYESAAKGFLVNSDGPAQRVASLHWVLTQQLSLATVLRRPTPAGLLAAARLSAEAYLDHASLQQRAWAHGSLAELCLLELASGPGPGDPNLIHEHARQHVVALCELSRRLDDRSPVDSTLQQFECYVSWWSDAGFLQATAQGAQAGRWPDEDAATLAKRLVQLLQSFGAPVVQTGAEGKAAPARSAPGPVPLRSAAAPVAPAVTAAFAPANASPKGDDSLAATRPRGSRPFLRVQMLPADHGDCLWIEYGRGRKLSRVLVDCGTAGAYQRVLKPKLLGLPAAERKFELLMLTHIDDDHIGGAIPLLKDAKSLGLSVADVWFNGWKHIAPVKPLLGARQGEQFSQLVQLQGMPWNAAFGGQAVVLPDAGALPTHTLPGGLTLTLLSPDRAKLDALAPHWAEAIAALGKTPGDDDFLRAPAAPADLRDLDALAESRFVPDGAEANGSSIAVLAEFEGLRVLLGADAHAPLLVQSLARLSPSGAPLQVQALKLPHHGSRANVSRELLQALRCRHYLVSTDGGRFQHPDAEAIARVIRWGGPSPELHFNADSVFSRRWSPEDLQRRHGYQARYPEASGDEGLTLTL